jgi:hypothetical protein
VRTVALVLLLALLGVSRAASQAAPLIREARAQLDLLNGDSAAPLLERALGARPNPAERVRALYLYGIALMLKERADRPMAQDVFRQAIRLSPSLRIDSLNVFGDEVVQEFQTALQAVSLAAEPGAAAPAVVRLTVTVEVPSDSTLAVAGELLPIVPRPSRRARGIVTVSPADAPTFLVWGDTLPAGGTGALGWNLRDRDGALVQPGRYALHVSAVDSTGEESAPIQRILTVERVPVDTQPLPPPLAPAAFEPETLRLKRASPSVLLVGAGLAAAAALLPEVLARTELNEGRDRDATSLAIAGTAAVAGVIGFVAGHRVQPVPEAARRNADLRQRDAASREEIVRTNAEARANAPVRVRLEAGGP